MKQVNMCDVENNFSKLTKMLDEKTEDYIIISRNGKPMYKLCLLDQNDCANRIGVGKGMFEIPDNFDDIDISDMFEGEIFPSRV